MLEISEVIAGRTGPSRIRGNGSGPTFWRWPPSRGDSPGAGIRPRGSSVGSAPGLTGDPPSGRRHQGGGNRADVGERRPGQEVS